jgi:tetratricopeptide (TPR) repeat protein
LVRKSRIAIEYCFKYRNQYPSSHVFWVHGGSKDKFKAAYEEIAEKLRIPDSETSSVNSLTTVSDWLSDEDNGPWLMIVDNADDDEAWVTSESPLISFLPRGKHGSILITTRNAQLGKTISNARQRPIEVPRLGMDDSVALLRCRVFKDDEVKIEDAKDLVSELGYLPLAITQAGAYMKENDMSIADYLALLKSSELNTTDLFLRQNYDDIRDPDIQNSVFRTWKISFDQISRQYPRTANFLASIALLDRQYIAVDLLRLEGESELEYKEAVQRLKAFSLITEEVKDKAFSMHRMVQLSIQWYLKSQNTLEYWQGQVLHRVELNLPDNIDIIAFEELLPHVQVVLGYTYSSESCIIQRTNVLMELGEYYYHLRQHSLATQCFRECLIIRESILGPEHEDTLYSMMRLGTSLYMGGLYKVNGESEILLRRVVELSIMEHPNLYVPALDSLGRILSHQEKFEEAEKIYKEMMTTVINRDGPDSSSASVAIHEFVFWYEAQGRYEEAEDLQRKAVGIAKTCQKDFGYGICMGRLASILELRGKYSEAIQIRRDLLTTRSDSLGPSHRITIESRGFLLRSMVDCMEIYNYYLDGGGEPTSTLPLPPSSQETAEFGRETLRLALEKLGFEDELTIAIRESFADCLSDIDQFDEAERMLEENLKLRITALGPGNSFSLESREKLAALMVQEGKYQEAEALFKENVKFELQTFELDGEFEDGPTTSALEKLATEMKDCGKVEDAERLLREVVVMNTQFFGAENSTTIQTMSLLARLLLGENKLEDAETISAEVFKHHVKAFKAMSKSGDQFILHPRSQKTYEALPQSSEGHIDLTYAIMDMHEYSQILVGKGKEEEEEEEAELASNEMVVVVTEVLGRQHPATFEAMILRGNLLEELGRHDDARTLFEETLNLVLEAAALVGKQTANDLERTAVLHEKLEKNNDAEVIYQQLLKLQMNKLGPLHEYTLGAMDKLGDILRKQAKYGESEAVYREVLRLRTQVLGPSHRRTLKTMRILGDVCKNQDKLSEVETIYRELLRITRETLGPGRPKTVKRMLLLGNLHAEQERFGEAYELYSEAWSIRKESLGFEHEDALQVRFVMGRIRQDEERYDEAEEIYRELFEIKTRIFGLKDKETLDVQNRLGEILFEQKRYEEAEKIMRGVLILTMETVGPDHIDTLITMGSLARGLSMMERHQEAEDLQRHVLNERVKMLGSEHKETLGIMYDLGKTLCYCGREDEAKTLLGSALQLHIKVFGPNAKTTLSVKKLLVEGPANRSAKFVSESTKLSSVARKQSTENADEDMGPEIPANNQLSEGSRKRPRDDDALVLRSRKRNLKVDDGDL